MLSNRPYLLRAFFDWIIDSHCTPVLVIDPYHPRCKIPKEYIDGDEIVFNIAPAAIRDLRMTNESVEFKASFSGVVHLIFAPVKAILALYAEENGEGIFFDAEEDVDSNITQIKNIEDTVLDEAGIVASEEQMPPAMQKSKPVLKLVE